MVNPKLRSEIFGDRADTSLVRIPAEIYPYSAGIKGGLLGGLAMIPMALAYGVISGRGIWYPVNLIAATFLPAWQHASPALLAQFHLDGLLIGLATHLVMSVVLGFIFAVMMPALPRTPLFWAFVIGPLLWGGAVYAGLPLFNPVMAHYIDLPSFALANIVYSLVLGLWMARTPKIGLDGSSSLNLRKFW
jgi:hypothetical protein